MIGGPHEGYELIRVYNLTHPDKFDDTNYITKLRWALIKQPRYSGRVYKKDQPDLDIWDSDSVYFTFYKGRGNMNKGDRMVCFYMKRPEVTEQDKMNWFKEMKEQQEWRDEPLF